VGKSVDYRKLFSDAVTDAYGETEEADTMWDRTAAVKVTMVEASDVEAEGCADTFTVRHCTRIEQGYSMPPKICCFLFGGAGAHAKASAEEAS
jgi:hypothetical protein